MPCHKRKFFVDFATENKFIIEVKLLILNMKKVYYPNFYTKAFTLAFVAFLCFGVFAQSAGDPQKGKEIFNANCAACHKLEGKMIGPALGGIEQKRSSEWLHKWIKNSANLIASGDKDAIAVFKEYNEVPMLAYETILSDQDIDDVLAYTSNPPAQTQEAAPAEQPSASTQETAPQAPVFQYTKWIVLAASVLMFLLLLAVIIKGNATLRYLAQASNREQVLKNSKYFPLWNVFLKNKTLINGVIALLFFASTFILYGYLMQIGVDKGYEPVQEIHYSHKIHAGDNQIDCKFCHSAARTSKTAGIPSLNVCMNCHVSIDEYNGAVEPEKGLTKEFYDGEIQKLYDAVGWDSENMKYTGEQKPVKWTRIHNLPDFAYFNHSQHVTAAGIACQECHGPIQEMEVVHQESALTMGWCVECHRKTEVDNTNPYYEKIHAQLAKKLGKDKLTIAELGGLECGKCHY